MARADTGLGSGPSTRDVRQAAGIAGALYLVTFLAGIPPALFLYRDVVVAGADALTASANGGIQWGALLDVVNACACVGTAVVLFPVLRRCRVRFGEALALGFVTARVLEAAIIFVGVVSLLSLVALRTGPTAARGMGGMLLTVHEWTVLLGPGLIPAFNAALLGWLLYRANLIPRTIPALGLLGAPLLATSAALSVLGVNRPGTVLSDLAVAPIFVWELSLGVYLLGWGFRPAAVAALTPSR